MLSLLRDTWRSILKLAWPVMATGSIRTTMRTVDLIVVGMFVGPAAVAAIGIGDVIGRIVLQIALGLGAGTIALVSQSYGAGRVQYADATTTQTVVIAIFFGVPIAVIGWIIAPSYFQLLGASTEVAEPGVLYLRVIIVTASFRILGIMGGRALAGAGDTRTPMVINVASTVVNIVLTLVLVIGPGSIPSYGVLGAAAGTAVGNIIVGLAFVGVFTTGRFRVSLRRDALYRPALAREIIRIGSPQVLDRNIYAFADIPLNGIILLFGTEVNAAFQIGRRVQQYARMPNWGFSTASSTLVGKYLGEEAPEKSQRYGWGSILLALLVTAPFAVVLFIWARPISSIFTNDPATLRFAVDWIRVLAIATVFQSVFSVLRGGLQGAGDTKWPMYASILGISGFTLGFSYLIGVTLSVGILGVYAGIVLDYVIRSIVVSYRFRSGAWKHLEIGTMTPSD